MREDFDVATSRLALVASTVADDESVTALREAASLLSAGKPRCGHFGETIRVAFFGSSGAELRSLALVPLGAGAAEGVLALGSVDADRFPPGVGTDFLARMGELITATVRRCSPIPTT